MRLAWSCWSVFSLGCGAVNPSGAVDAAAPGDAAPSDAPALCDPTARFGAPTLVAGLSGIGLAYVGPRLSADELTVYFASNLPSSDANIYTATRPSRNDPFGAPKLMDAQNSSSSDFDPAISPDGLDLWFSSNRIANQSQHLYVATRGSTFAAFGQPGLADNVNAADTNAVDFFPFVTADGNELWFASTRNTGSNSSDLWRAVKTGQSFGQPAPVGELNTLSSEYCPTLSADRLTVYFSSNRTGASAAIWVSHRTSADDGFRTPAPVDELNAAGFGFVSWISSDNCRIYGTANGMFYTASR